MASSPEPIAVLSQQLDDFFTDIRERGTGLGDEAALFLDAAHDAAAGGKRLRARFCLAGAHAAGQAEPGPAVRTAAAALELFHAAALVHDDLIDNSDTRRGRPAAHRALQAAHAGRRWRGDAEAFGRAGAILLGDLLLSLADELFERGAALAPVDATAGARARYQQMRREVTVGQFLDVAEESAYASAPLSAQAERALRVASLKSARYSVQQPLVIGARLAGGDDRIHDALTAFGLPVGMAFQLRDDVLGVFGDERRTGKPAGDDLREGKRTVLIAYTRERASAADRDTLDELLGDRRLTDAQVAQLQRIIRDCGALERVERLIDDYRADADAALGAGALDETATATLRALADAATVRVA